MKHVLKGSLEAPCDCAGREGHCMVCDGALALCVVCGGAEGSLPTDCPGRQLTSEEQDHIYEGVLDFVDGVMILG